MNNIMVFKTVTLYGLVGAYKHYGRTSCLHLQGEIGLGDDVVRLYGKIAWMVATQIQVGRRGNRTQYYSHKRDIRETACSRTTILSTQERN